MANKRICKICGSTRFADFKGRKICAVCTTPRYKIKDITKDIRERYFD